MPKFTDDQALARFFRNYAKLLGDHAGLFMFMFELPECRYHVVPQRGAYNVKDDTVYDIDEYLDTVISPDDRSMVGDRFAAVMAGEEETADFTCRVVDAKGSVNWVNMHLHASLGEDGKPNMMGGYITDIDDLRRTDPDTGLFNQNQFYADYSKGLPGHQPGYVVLFDIDDFKFINECYGRSFGDKLIKALADVLRKSLTATMRVYRMEADTFILVAPGCTRSQINELYEAVRQRYAQQCRRMNKASYCTLSAGAAAYPDDSAVVKEIIRFCQGALKTAKLAGKDTLVFFSLEEYQSYQAELGLQAELRRAVQNSFEGFELYYQAQVSLATGRVEGAEALLRWNSTEHGFMPPDKFIPMLEKTGMIVEVGRWVLDTALHQCAHWRTELPDFVMSVNLSYQQLENDDIAAYVTERLHHHHLPGSCLVLELTESEQLHNFSYFNQSLEPLGKMGVGIAIDDFGTGYSSLGYFKELHINQVKIDRCFVTRIQESEYDFRLIEFIVDLAHSTNMEVCVEGVENAEELKALMPLSPDLYQGYFFARPMPTAQFTQVLQAYGGRLDEDLVRLASQLKKKDEGASPLFLSAVDEYKQLLDENKMPTHITELDTGKLLYLNRAGRLAFGVRNYDNRACYEVLRGRTRPCEKCWSVQLSRDEFYHWKTEATASGEIYESRIKLIPWDGRMVRLGMCIKDHRGAEGSEEAVQKADELLLSCLRTLMYDTKPGDAIKTALWYIGDYYKPERVDVYEFVDDQHDARKTYEWCRDDATPERDKLTFIPADAFPQWMDMILHGRPIAINNLEDMERLYPEEAATMRSHNIYRRIMVVPLFTAGRPSGFMVADNCEREGDRPAFMMNVGYFVGSEVAKQNLLDELDSSVSRDGLTGAFSRKTMTDDMEGRYLGAATMGVVCADINGLKDINENEGIEAGDAALCELYEDLHAAFTSSRIYRTADSEFVVVCGNISIEAFQKQQTALRRRLRQRSFTAALGFAWTDNKTHVGRPVVFRAENYMREEKNDTV